jgi:hypothetical protein
MGVLYTIPSSPAWRNKSQCRNGGFPSNLFYPTSESRVQWVKPNALGKVLKPSLVGWLLKVGLGFNLSHCVPKILREIELKFGQYHDPTNKCNYIRQINLIEYEFNYV